MDVQTIEQLHQDPTLRNRVARRAYELFIRRGRQMGREAEDWFQAEKEILQEVLEEQNQFVSTKEVTLEAQAQKQEALLDDNPITTQTVAEENNLDSSTPKKRTYTRKKKAADGSNDTLEANQQITSAEIATNPKTSETTTTPRARRTRNKTNIASDLA
ncbi:MAG: DUF2934 domain-containing protein [Acidobacteria bacterium]|nr:DUF2934 domain-containing protein [Acidobacteriota bacterium]